MDEQTLKMDEQTLKEVFMALRSAHPEAAVKVASWILERSPKEWAAMHRDEYDTKLELVKAIRAEYGLSLKDAKEVADNIW